MSDSTASSVSHEHDTDTVFIDEHGREQHTQLHFQPSCSSSADSTSSVPTSTTSSSSGDVEQKSTINAEQSHSDNDNAHIEYLKQQISNIEQQSHTYEQELTNRTNELNQLCNKIMIYRWKLGTHTKLNIKSELIHSSPSYCSGNKYVNNIKITMNTMIQQLDTLYKQLSILAEQSLQTLLQLDQLQIERTAVMKTVRTERKFVAKKMNDLIQSMDNSKKRISTLISMLQKDITSMEQNSSNSTIYQSTSSESRFTTNDDHTPTVQPSTVSSAASTTTGNTDPIVVSGPSSPSQNTTLHVDGLNENVVKVISDYWNENNATSNTTNDLNHNDESSTVTVEEVKDVDSPVASASTSDSTPTSSNAATSTPVKHKVTVEDVTCEPTPRSSSSSTVPPTPTVSNSVPIINITSLLDQSTTLKEQGNQLFRDQQYDKAFECYENAYNLIKSIPLNVNSTTERDIRLGTLLVALHGNLSACYLIQKDFNNVINHCSECLKIDEHHIKSLIRRGKAYAAQSNDALALADLLRASQITHDVATKQELTPLIESLQQKIIESKINSAQQKEQIKQKNRERMEKFAKLLHESGGLSNEQQNEHSHQPMIIIPNTAPSSPSLTSPSSSPEPEREPVTFSLADLSDYIRQQRELDAQRGKQMAAAEQQREIEKQNEFKQPSHEFQSESSTNNSTSATDSTEPSTLGDVLKHLFGQSKHSDNTSNQQQSAHPHSHPQTHASVAPASSQPQSHSNVHESPSTNESTVKSVQLADFLKALGINVDVTQRNHTEHRAPVHSTVQPSQPSHVQLHVPTDVHPHSHSHPQSNPGSQSSSNDRLRAFLEHLSGSQSQQPSQSSRSSQPDENDENQQQLLKQLLQQHLLKQMQSQPQSQPQHAQHVEQRRRDEPVSTVRIVELPDEDSSSSYQSRNTSHTQPIRNINSNYDDLHDDSYVDHIVFQPILNGIKRRTAEQKNQNMNNTGRSAHSTYSFVPYVERSYVPESSMPTRDPFTVHIPSRTVRSHQSQPQSHADMYERANFIRDHEEPVAHPFYSYTSSYPNSKPSVSHAAPCHSCGQHIPHMPIDYESRAPPSSRGYYSPEYATPYAYQSHHESRVPPHSTVHRPVETASSSVPIHLYELNDRYTFSADVPGFDASNVSVSLDHDGYEHLLHVQGVRSDSYASPSSRSRRFHRTVRVPANTDIQNITSTVQNGQLHIHIPKVSSRRNRTNQHQHQPVATGHYGYDHYPRGNYNSHHSYY